MQEIKELQKDSHNAILELLTKTFSQQDFIKNLITTQEKTRIFMELSLELLHSFPSKKIFGVVDEKKILALAYVGNSNEKGKFFQLLRYIYGITLKLGFRVLIELIKSQSTKPLLGGSYLELYFLATDPQAQNKGLGK